MIVLLYGHLSQLLNAEYYTSKDVALFRKEGRNLLRRLEMERLT